MSIHNPVRGLVLTTCLIAGCALFDQEDDIEVADVPAAAIAAAEAAVEGLVITAAEAEVGEDETVYELEGNAGDTEYEIEVTADGRVLEVEADD